MQTTIQIIQQIVDEQQTSKQIDTKERRANMKRKIIFNDYRNLGIGKPEELIINIQENNEHEGELIIVIGGNNTGKSNVLDGIMALTSKAGINTERDAPDFIYSDLDPYVKITVSNEKNKWSYIIRPNGQNSYEDSNKVADANKVSDKPQYEMSNDMKDFLIRWNLDYIKKTMQAGEKLDALHILTLRSHIDSSKHSFDWLKLLQEMENYIEKFVNNDTVNDEIEAKVREETGIPLRPKIVKYEERPILQREMNINVSELQNSNFITKIFRLIEVEIEEVQNCYKQFQNNGVKAILTKFQEQINTKLEKLTNPFNKMYAFDSNEYKFEFSFESDKIYFSITYANKTPLNIDKQSTGFRWFFNFYINTLNEKDLGKGDIIIMDEPATNLHARGMTELRDFLKEYAKKSGITFIISTHSPFMLDIDYLDELRIVKKEDENAVISNDFELINKDSKDTLFDILSSLTIGRHVVLNPNDALIFVEGVSDYNYLVAFKKHFLKNNINFLPVNGLKDKKLHEKLLEIKDNPILLVDGDTAGKIAEENDKNKTITFINLKKHIDEKFTTIEDLFVGKDRELIDNPNKKYKSKKYTSLYVKKNFSTLAENFSTETIKNFEKLFEHLDIL